MFLKIKKKKIEKENRTKNIFKIFNIFGPMIPGQEEKGEEMIAKDILGEE